MHHRRLGGAGADVGADALLAKAVERQQESKHQLMTVFPPWSRDCLVQRGFVETPSATWLRRRLIHNVYKAEITPEFLSGSGGIPSATATSPGSRPTGGMANDRVELESKIAQLERTVDALSENA